MKIAELIGKSGDSELLGYEYVNNVLNVRMEVPDIDAKVELTIQTECVSSRFNPEGGVSANTCFLELVELGEVCCLDENGIIVPPDGFTGMMQQAREGYHLVYGQRLKETPYLLRLKGNVPLLVCAIRSLDEIGWEVKE